MYTDSFTTLTGSFAPPGYAEIVLEDPTATLLGGFPTIPDPANLVPLLPADGSRAVRMDMEAGVSFEITGLSAAARATPVPAPGAAWLALLGLAGSGWLRRRKTM